MKTLKLVVEREYMSRVTKKSFIILTILMPFIFVALVFVPLWLANIKDTGSKKIAVIDKTGLYAGEFKSTEEYQYEVVGRNDTSLQSQLGGELYAILQITDDLSKNPRAITLTSEKQAPMGLIGGIQSTLSEKVTQQKLDELTASGSMDPESIKEVRNIIESGSNISVSTLRWSSDGEVKETSSIVSTIIGFVFTMLIYMFIMIYGSMVMQAVMEEKSSRIVEVMVSSVKPVNLLIGKIIGIGMVGLTQLFIWGMLIVTLMMGVGTFLGLSSDAMTGAMAGANTANLNDLNNFDINQIMNMISSINWLEIVVYFILFFIGGFVLYASIFAMIGASVDSEQDSQQFMTPVTLLLLFGFYAGFYSIENPDGPLAVWCSFIPFTSPIVMMVRIPFGIPFWEIIVSIVILYGTFILFSMFAAKIYRVGILMYGKKPSIKEIIKWATYK